MIDGYRTTLFKRRLREVIGAPWLRFYFSKGKCHLCVEAHDFKKEDVPRVIQSLKRSGIDFNLSHWPEILGGKIWTINIPIDQAALPERKRKYMGRICSDEK